jgi:hypothetical protein
MTALQQISKRAKAIQKHHKNKAWKDCIKQASKEYNSGKKIGSSMRKPGAKEKKVVSFAKKQGVRLKHGNETVKRRSMGAVSNVLADLNRTVKEIEADEKSIIAVRKMIAETKNAALKNVYRKDIAAKQKYVSALKKHKTKLKALL